jgi:hypothetical protein
MDLFRVLHRVRRDNTHFEDLFCAFYDYVQHLLYNVVLSKKKTTLCYLEQGRIKWMSPNPMLPTSTTIHLVLTLVLTLLNKLK